MSFSRLQSIIVDRLPNRKGVQKLFEYTLCQYSSIIMSIIDLFLEKNMLNTLV